MSIMAVKKGVEDTLVEQQGLANTLVEEQWFKCSKVEQQRVIKYTGGIERA